MIVFVKYLYRQIENFIVYLIIPQQKQRCLQTYYTKPNINYTAAGDCKMKRSFYEETSHNFLFSMYTSSKKNKFNRFRIHKHTELEFGYIIKGSGIYILADLNYTAADGDIFLVRPGEQYCIPTITTPELVSLTFQISSYYLWNVCSDYISYQKLRALVSTSMPITQRFHADGETKAVLSELLSLLCDESEETRYRIKFLVLRLLVILTGFLECEKQPFEVRNAHLEDVQNAIQYINAHISEPITLSDISNAVNLCNTALTSSFKTVTGLTPYKYLIIQRIKKSIELLRDTDLTVIEIAQKCGFQNTVTFNRSFRQITGLTPTEFRCGK